jgi:hypothetical protein
MEAGRMNRFTTFSASGYAWSVLSDIDSAAGALIAPINRADRVGKLLIPEISRAVA